MLRQLSRRSIKSSTSGMSDKRYRILGGMVHVKSLVLLKCMCVIIVVLREFQLDLNMHSCLFPPYEKDCAKGCVWLMYWLGSPPFAVSYPSCTILMCCVLVSSVFMITALALKEREMRGVVAYTTFCKSFFIVPFTTIEVLAVLLVYYHSFIGLHARIYAPNVPTTYVLVSFAHTFLLCAALLVDVALHCLCCSYVMESLTLPVSSASYGQVTVMNHSQDFLLPRFPPRACAPHPGSVLSGVGVDEMCISNPAYNTSLVNPVHKMRSVGINDSVGRSVILDSSHLEEFHPSVRQSAVLTRPSARRLGLVFHIIIFETLVTFHLVTIRLPIQNTAILRIERLPAYSTVHDNHYDGPQLF